MVGKTLSHYEILEPLGAGGMGEVYRARDTKLDRDVAIKVLPDDLAADAERLARFEREAKLLAALNHSNIGAIYGLEETDSVHFLVLELIEGESLERRLRRGAMPVAEALDIARQIAEALEAAHDAGIIHRDVKPTNVLLTGKGGVKVLDFGIAKSTLLDGATNAALTEQATSLTVDGTLMGTPPYMAPEQIRGQEADRRADIWAFGCVMYEMLAGKAAFARETVADTLVAVLDAEPVWEALPASLPRVSVTVLQRCLRKDPNRRLRDIGDARIEIEEAQAGSPITVQADGMAASRPARWQRIVPWAVAGLMTAIAAVIATQIGTYRASEPQRFVAIPPDVQPSMGQTSSSFAFSPDGSLLYTAPLATGDGQQLYLKQMGQLRGTPIEGSEAALGPFFSPAGDWIGFQRAGGLWKIPTAGGAAQPVLEDVPVIRGASWGPAVIVFGTYTGGLQKVPADGGRPEVLTELDAPAGERSHRWPEVLPDGDTVLFNIWSGGSHNDDEIAVVSLETGVRTRLSLSGTFPRYAPTGHLLFVRTTRDPSESPFEGSLWAVGFDLERLEVTGSPIVVQDGVQVRINGPGVAHYQVSAEGTLAYAPPTQGVHDTVRVDRTGALEPSEIPPGRADEYLRFSPDGRFVALNDYSDIHVYDMERRGTRHLTVDLGDSVDGNAIWTPGSKRLVFSSNRNGVFNMYSIAVDGAAEAEQLLPSPNLQYPTSVSSDGVLLYQEYFGSDRQYDIMAMPLDGDRVPTLLVGTKADEGSAVFSPDGRLFAYTSTEAGTRQVWVQTFPDLSTWRERISDYGGRGPVWSPAGDELFFVQENRLMVARVTTTPVFRADRPTQLWVGENLAMGPGTWAAAYDTPDGETFLFRRVLRREPPSIYLVLNWFEELKNRVPAR